MSTYDPSIIEKVKKLFALGQSPNSHEASLALEMAQRLMAAHNLTMNDVEVGEIKSERLSSIATATKAKDWELHLYDSVVNAFGCGLMFSAGYPYAAYVFVGPKTEVALALYAATFLQRALVRARSAFTATLKDKRDEYGDPLNRADKTAEVDAYCRGWVRAAVAKVEHLVPNPAKVKAIALYIDQNKGGGKVKTNARGGGSHDAAAQGRADGDSVSLNKPVGGAAGLALDTGSKS